MKTPKAPDAAQQSALREKARQADLRINAVLKDLGLRLQHSIDWEKAPEGWIRPKVVSRYVGVK